MKIAISATGPDLDAEVDPRFGRCQYFIIADPETMEFEAVENSSAMASGGAGISTGQMISGKGAQVVLTGNCGPNAYQTLSAAGIQVITGVSGTVRDAIEGYKSGQLQAISQPNVAAHFGMGGTATGISGAMGGGMDMGGGMGHGMGMGRGMGRGMGMGGGMGGGMMPPVSPAPQPMTPEQEVESLKAQSQILAQQLSDIQQRIEELGKGNK
ncbi:MAG: dinitrogenase iron-molybdenum cofactor biosynthesis protein [Dehalococcoidia bacterium]|nr:MAG: dinitrogenase iron-molybdenum cofactor biosynthesis protein [Dehalococcoidia bacterium]